ncbi:hypothetical protein J2X68_007826 [Streptomyces sp. 3330]|uniref:hypothetical protein n=1 Tax=Streptomyces sp. 3330 TaxID=2817755 RepID=UPI0028656AF5|nr:hypothetical protein [Streptomyces sp. 3330]MDR6981084.1 hypothetical protein [Streptomyces sp. 3330]
MRRHRDGSFVLEDQPCPERRRGGFARGQVSFTQPADRSLVPFDCPSGTLLRRTAVVQVERDLIEGPQHGALQLAAQFAQPSATSQAQSPSATQIDTCTSNSHRHVAPLVDCSVVAAL